MNMFPEGRLELPGIGMSTEAGIKEVSERIARQNSGKNLHEVFFNGSRDTLHIERGEGYEVAIRIPNGPWGHVSLMVVAARPEWLEETQVKTRTAYDLPEEAQELYWRYGFQILEFFHNHAIEEGEEGSYEFFIMENCIVEYSSDKHRTSRSVGAPHYQVIAVHKPSIRSESFEFDHLTNEQKVQQHRMFERWLASVNTKSLEPYLAEHDLRKRTEAPFGYSFVLREGLTSLERAAFLREHHRLYKEASEPLFERYKRKNTELIPQPSYRMYLHFVDKGRLEIIICPEFLSHAGVIEAGGAKLHRNESHPSRIQPEKLRRYQERAVETILRS